METLYEFARRNGETDKFWEELEAMENRNG